MYLATFKILLIGNSNVGKSSLLLRFTDDTFLTHDEVSATIGVDFKVHEIGDTAGQERFRTLTSSYYRGAQGVILDDWFNELNTYCTSKNIVKMIVGNKIDKENGRAISRKEGEAYARKSQTLFIECSAKTKYGVREAFEELVRKIIEDPNLWQKRSETLDNKIDISLLDQNQQNRNDGDDIK
ncbi:5319_t:CDS:2 [Entrophospora sp. SA101]|nr:5319_t:CDS:2 [Entrophospora sp. SA101]CAJ0826280.1 22038_t:CDS:2 [Entrophospora sp. SA101]